MIFLVLNALMRLTIMAVLVYKLTHFRDLLNRAELIGLGVVAGSAFLTIPAIFRIPDNPYEGWSGALLSFGLLVYFGGRMSRHYRHARRNEEQRQIARAWHRGEAV